MERPPRRRRVDRPAARVRAQGCWPGSPTPTAALPRPWKLLAGGHLADALPLGLVCEAVWRTADTEALKAQGRIEQYLGGAQLDAATIDAYAEAARHVVTELLGTEPASDDHRTGKQTLDRAEDLLVQFERLRRPAQPAAGTGFDHRAEEVAKALQAALAEPTPKRMNAVAARSPASTTTTSRGPAAPRRAGPHGGASRRLAATPADRPQSVADAVDRQVREWGWVDPRSLTRGSATRPTPGCNGH